MENTELQRALIMGAALGIVAAAVVWFLERYQTDRLASELRQHLDSLSDEYQQWLSQRPQFRGGGPGE